MAYSKSVTKSIGDALSSPTGWILAAGVVYLAYRTWKLVQLGLKDVAAGFNPNPVMAPSEQPVGAPPETWWVTARITEPANNGVAARGFFDRKFKVVVSLGNPTEKQTVDVQVRVSVYAGAGGRPPEILQSAQRVELEAALTKTFEFWFQWAALFSAPECVAEVYVNGKSMATPVRFQLD